MKTKKKTVTAINNENSWHAIFAKYCMNIFQKQSYANTIKAKGNKKNPERLLYNQSLNIKM